MGRHRAQQYQAVFIDGPAKGRVQALYGPANTVRFAEMPMLTARLLNEKPEAETLEIMDIVYVLHEHYAPCGRGKFMQLTGVTPMEGRGL